MKINFSEYKNIYQGQNGLKNACLCQSIKPLKSDVSFASKDILQARKLVKYPVKVIFSDVDGTIADSQQKISQKHLTAIKKLKEAGIPLIIATGRGYKAVDGLFGKLNMQPQTIITESGAVIVDSAKRKLYENKLTLDNVQKIRKAFDELKAPDTYFRLTFDGDPYIEGSAEAFKTSSVKTYPLRSFDELLDKGYLPTRALIAKFNSKSYNDIEMLLQRFREILGNSLNIFNSGTKYAEITNRDVSKSGAIGFLQKYFGWDYRNTACIGDAANDVCMAELLSKNGGVSVSMGNGIDAMKKSSRFITDDVDNGGFSKFVDAILEINNKFC